MSDNAKKQRIQHNQSSINTLKGRVALIIVTSAAMIEYGGIPIWVGILMGHYGFDPQQAGSLVSLYLVGAVVSGLITAPIFGRLTSGKTIACLGLLSASVVFYSLTLVNGYVDMLVLHLIGGLSVGPVLSVSQGSIGRSNNPHRLFSMTAVASSITAAVFLGIMPSIVAQHSGILFFQVVACIFIFGAFVALIGFPSTTLMAQPNPQPNSHVNPQLKPLSLEASTSVLPKMSPKVWYGLIGLSLMAVVYSMTMSFVERVGMERNYGLATVSTVLSIMAFTKLFPAAVAGFLENKLSFKAVLFSAPIVQALACTLIFAVPSLYIYAISAPIFITTLLFAQVFAFGYIATLDPSGRASALSPSIMLMGSGLGPVLGGSVVKVFGYPALSIIGLVLATIVIYCFSRAIVNSKNKPTITAN